MTRRFDAIVIGAGQAGPSLAARLAGTGKSVALIERHLLGGTCVNTGCTPTKTLVASAYAAHLARRAADYGVTVGGPVGIDIKAVMARKNAVVVQSRDGLGSWLETLDNLTVIKGHARLLSAGSVEVGGEQMSAERIFLNVGGRPDVPAMPGIETVPVLTSSAILDLEEIPEHLVVVGGSYVGLEFAQIFRRFGSRVTVVEKGPRLVLREDEDTSAAIRAVFEAEGIAVRTSAECIRFAQRADGIGVGVECASGDPEILGSHVLMAVGRRPNTGDLGLEKAGVAVDGRGFITVDSHLATSAPGIWALGDCNGRGAFTHTAYNDYEIVAENLLDGANRRVEDRIPAYALYTDPPLGRVGLTKAQAVAAGHTIRVGRRPMSRVARAVEKGETEGFMEVVVDAETDAILGAAIFGVGGDEVVHGILDVMAAKAPASLLRRTVHIHPTVSELVPTILGELKAWP
jgi:pyruvate/2-oxoglutarate dehydrogenase complex dihydrolipoamide dehydrogenase (E3) component